MNFESEVEERRASQNQHEPRQDQPRSLAKLKPSSISIRHCGVSGNGSPELHPCISSDVCSLVLLELLLSAFLHVLRRSHKADSYFCSNGRASCCSCGGQRASTRRGHRGRLRELTLHTAQCLPRSNRRYGCAPLQLRREDPTFWTACGWLASVPLKPRHTNCPLPPPLPPSPLSLPPPLPVPKRPAGPHAGCMTMTSTTT